MVANTSNQAITIGDDMNYQEWWKSGGHEKWSDAEDTSLSKAKQMLWNEAQKHGEQLDELTRKNQILMKMIAFINDFDQATPEQISHIEKLAIDSIGD